MEICVKKFIPLVFVVVEIVFSTTINAQSFAISSVVQQTVGTSSNIQGGSANNTDTFNTGTVGIFGMNGGSAYMVVTASNNTGALRVGDDSLMVVRTTNSQGLTDDATLSVYVRPSLLNQSATLSRWSLDLNFSFFSDAALSTQLPINLRLTSLDIDTLQRYYVQDSDFTSSSAAPVTSITSPSISFAGYTGFTAAGNASFGDAANAVASFGSSSSFDVRLANENNGSSSHALYMFDFRDPSPIVNIPEASSFLLFATSMIFGVAIRRRK